MNICRWFSIILFLCSISTLHYVRCDDGLDFDDDILKELGLDDLEIFNFDKYDGPMLFRSPLSELALWMKTSGARTRDPLFLIPHRRLTVDKPGVEFNLFFNKTNSVHINPNMVLNTKAVDLLDEFMTPGSDLDDTETTEIDDLLRILPYIKKMTVQERRIGGMINIGINDRRWRLQIDTPILFAERNFWLEAKKDRKDFETILDDLNSLEGGSVIKKRFGLGDTKLKLGYSVCNSDVVNAVFGIQGILPTSRMGQKKPGHIVTSKAGDTRKKLINDLLDMTKQLMIDPKLGTGHWGLGAFLDMRIHIIPETLDFWSRMSFDYLFPGSESRYMASTKTIPISQLDALTSSDTIPEDFPITDLFPYLVDARVYPGSIFNATVGLDWNVAKEWKLCIGYDFYAQQSEKIKNVSVPNIDESLLRIEDAIASEIVQHKIFGQVEYTKKGRDIDWHFGLGGDVTIGGQGDGAKDWTVFGKIGITF